jgi:hypothetical protein
MWGMKDLIKRPPTDVEPRRSGQRVVTSYLTSVYEPGALKKTGDSIYELMLPHLDSIDAIAFRGSSGAALAYPLSVMTSKPLIHVRKELGHSWRKVEGLYGAKRIAVVDDFVASGDTIRIIWEEIVAAYKTDGYPVPEFSHLFLYAARFDDSDEQIRGKLGDIVANSNIQLAWTDSRR